MGGCLKRTPVCCSIRLRKSGGDIKSLSMRSIGIRSGTEYMQTDRPRFVILLFTNMEYHPEYFGPYPAPLATPRGRTARYKPLMNGIFWIETGTGEEVLAVCYPIWNCDFSETVLKQSEQTEEDVREGIDNTLGYLFFSKRASSLALFELWGQYEELRAGGLIDYPALMNYIWAHFPEYAATYNIQNQMGMHDTFGLLMNALGAEMELQNDPSKVIAMSKAAGLDFLNF